ncbi:MAG: anaerobic C4-dicarboxylate transporter [Oscillospiraceae bacterium]|nr:anaerobic C4-dicarboxylate transporter [Oscillospiraceae bacterium]
MFWIELIIVMAMIFLGTRKGGPFLALAGGLGMLILTFVLRVPPSDPPITVIRIMIAVIVAASCMQAAGGLDYMVKLAEKILRKHPEHITLLGPIVAYIFTFMCGTGHIVYSLLPVINEIAMETGVRPERPISASVVASQNAITACPISAATAGILGLMVAYEQINLFTLLIVCVPATLLGAVAAGLSVMKRGKELSEDPEYLERVKAGLVKDYKLDHTQEKPVTKQAKTAVIIFMVAMLAIVLLGAVTGLRPSFADGSSLGMTTIIEIFMLVGAALMVLICRFDSNKMLDQPVFKTGMFAVVLAYGLCWMVNTFIGDQSGYISETMSAVANRFPWIYIIAVFIVAAITTSQASTTMIMIPIGMALNLPVYIIIAGWVCCNCNYFIPASGQCVAAIGFDSAGTTKIGKYVLNHSYMLPGLVMTVVSVLAALGLGLIVYR